MFTTALNDLLQYDKFCTRDDIFYFNDDSIYVANHCWRENLRWPPLFRSRRNLAYPKDFLKNVIISLCTFDNFNKYQTMRVYAKIQVPPTRNYCFIPGRLTTQGNRSLGVGSQWWPVHDRRQIGPITARTAASARDYNHPGITYVKRCALEPEKTSCPYLHKSVVSAD